MAFTSILFEGADGPPAGASHVPDYAADLHLDDIVRAAIAGNEEHQLARVFYQWLPDTVAITYRHDVFRDLEDAALLEAIRSFGRGWRSSSVGSLTPRRRATRSTRNGGS